MYFFTRLSRLSRNSPVARQAGEARCFSFSPILYIIGYGQIYPHLLHFPHPNSKGHEAMYGVGQPHLGAGSVRCAGKKVQKAIYIVKSAAQSMGNFRGEATERNYSLGKFRQWPSGKNPHAGNCWFFRGSQNLMSSPTPITLLVRE